MTYATLNRFGAKDIAGQRFGRLVAIRAAGTGPGRKLQWLCVCDCGTEKTMSGKALRTGRTTSCGCFASELMAAVGRTNRVHGMASTGTYEAWHHMLSRCESPEDKDYPRYGARGIAVCERWHSFPLFLEDMGERPDGLTLDREDNDGPYSRENCRWATPTQQARNRRSNRLLTRDGVARPVAEWAELTGVSTATLNSRLHRGWSEERALSEPVDGRFSRA